MTLPLALPYLYVVMSTFGSRRKLETGKTLSGTFLTSLDNAYKRYCNIDMHQVC